MHCFLLSWLINSEVLLFLQAASELPNHILLYFPLPCHSLPYFQQLQKTSVVACNEDKVFCISIWNTILAAFTNTILKTDLDEHTSKILQHVRILRYQQEIRKMHFVHLKLSHSPQLPTSAPMLLLCLNPVIFFTAWILFQCSSTSMKHLKMSPPPFNL